MRLTKKPKLEFHYISSLKNINKNQRAPKFLSKENINFSKYQNSNIISKDSIFNNNIPIKVLLIKAAHLNPNINVSKIHKVNKSAKMIKKEYINENKNKNINLKQINKSKENKININDVSKKFEIINNNNFNNIRGFNEKDNLVSNNSINQNQGDIYTLKNLLINSKIIKKDKKQNKFLNINNINIKTHKFNSKYNQIKEDIYNRNSYKLEYNKTDVNFFNTNFTYNKPKKGSRMHFNYSSVNKISKISKKILHTEDCGSNIMSTDNILSNTDKVSFNSNNFSKKKINNSICILEKNNQKDDLIKVNKKNKKKIYKMKTHTQSDNSNVLILNRKNTSPIRVKKFSNNNNFNITNNNYKYIYLSPKKHMINTNLNDEYHNIEIKLEDLVLFGKKLDDIYLALSSKNHDSGALNECLEFILFYFNSSLKDKFPYFFNGMNKVIIKSAVNLNLFSIVITYHLSSNPVLLSKLINELRNIFSLSKNNFYLFVKKIQLFYGEKYVIQNELYFKRFNYILLENGYNNFNEDQIVKIINTNCYELVNIINNIINFYKSIDNNYYLDFFEIFISISKITEIEIHNYFYTHLYANPLKGSIKPKYISIKPNENDYLNNSLNSNIRNKTYSKSKEKEFEIKTILKYHKYKVSPPFIKKLNEKEYSLVLDLEDTFIHINEDNNFKIRPGLYSFLTIIKPYYEIISFTNESKYSSNSVIKQIETKNKYFDYNLYKEHLSFNGKEFFKDISKLGRDIKKVIVIDNNLNSFKLNPENVIKITPFLGQISENDTELFELQKILILIYKSGYEDLRLAIKKFTKEKENNITINEINDKNC